jgi:uncharacterized membrane protein YfcA
VLASIGGVALAFLLPPRVSAIVFGVFMLLIAIQLAVRAIRARRN